PVEDDDGRPSLQVALLVALGGADAVGEQVPGGAVDDLAGRERGMPGEFVRPAAAPLVPGIRPVVEARALERLAVIAEVEPALAVAQPYVAEIEPTAGDGPLELHGAVPRVSP